MKFVKLLTFFLIVAFFPVNAHSQESTEIKKDKVIAVSAFSTSTNRKHKEDEVIVTATRLNENILRIPANVTVITREEIEESTAETVADILGMEPSVFKADWTGSGKTVTLGLRGFGERDNENVLVLVNGRRINPIDMSGIDWRQTPLERVKRIEIIRGGNSVLYGENAVGGVINIITDKWKKSTTLKLSSGYGSLNRFFLNALAEGVIGKRTYYSVSGNYIQADGYRRNSFIKARDFGFEINHNLIGDSWLNFDFGYHRDEYGLPGYLSDMTSPKSTDFPDDNGETEDYYFQLKGLVGSEKIGVLTVPISIRIRKNPFISWGFEMENDLNVFGILPQYQVDIDLNIVNISTTIGLDYYKNWYTSMSSLSTNDIEKESVAGYATARITFFNNRLNLCLGYRYEQAKFEFRYTDNNLKRKNKAKPNSSGFQAGTSFEFFEDSKLFVNYSSSFRFPVTDEYLVYQFDATWVITNVILNTQLKPQKGNHLDIGVNYNLKEILNVKTSFFWSEIENEIYYDKLNGANLNYPKTLHLGVETEIGLKIKRFAKIKACYTYTHAKIKGGIYKDKFIPGVPQHKVSAVLSIFPFKNLSFSYLSNYVGKRYLISDHNNPEEMIASYCVCNINISYKFFRFKIFANCKNLFGLRYADCIVWTGSPGGRAYYPSPGRSFNFGITYEF